MKEVQTNDTMVFSDDIPPKEKEFLIILQKLAKLAWHLRNEIKVKTAF